MPQNSILNFSGSWDVAPKKKKKKSDFVQKHV